MNDRFNTTQESSSPEKVRTDFGHVNKAVQKVDEDGVQPDNPEKERPFFPQWMIVCLHVVLDILPLMRDRACILKVDII